jgi:predicted nucleic acid-binding Zn ribbon protein
MTVNNISSSIVSLTVQSTIQNITLQVNQTKKLSLENPGFYDLLMKLNSITDERANLTIQTINEPIIKKPQIEERNLTIHEENFDEEVEKIKAAERVNDYLNFEQKRARMFFYGFLIIFIIVIIIIFLIISVYIKKNMEKTRRKIRKLKKSGKKGKTSNIKKN